VERILLLVVVEGHHCWAVEVQTPFQALDHPEEVRSRHPGVEEVETAAHGRPLDCFTIRLDPIKTVTVADDASLPTNNNGAVLGMKLIFRSTYRRTVGLRSRMTSLWPFYLNKYRILSK
jgi:hypothetical protein